MALIQKEPLFCKVFDAINWSDGNTEYNRALNWAATQIREAKETESKTVIHGVWFGTVCSNCAYSDCNYFDHKYCPNCGAEMVDTDESYASGVGQAFSP